MRLCDLIRRQAASRQRRLLRRWRLRNRIQFPALSCYYHPNAQVDIPTGSGCVRRQPENISRVRVFHLGWTLNMGQLLRAMTFSLTESTTLHQVNCNSRIIRSCSIASDSKAWALQYQLHISRDASKQWQLFRHIQWLLLAMLSNESEWWR